MAAELPAVEEGKTYVFKNAVSSEWNDRMEIILNKSSSIEETPDDIPIQGKGQGTSSLVKVADISQDGQWIDVKGKIVQLWENTSESISQIGLIGDETANIKFIKWARAEIPVDVVEGRNYIFRNAVTSEWNGKLEITLNKTSSIEEISDEIDVIARDAVLTAAMVDIQSGSGLIKRCPQCNRSLTKGACAEHGKVDGVYDLRLKAVLDTGTIAQDILLKREVTEEISGITLEGAIAMAADALDQGVVLEAMKQNLLGKYYMVSGPRVDGYILVESIKRICSGLELLRSLYMKRRCSEWQVIHVKLPEGYSLRNSGINLTFKDGNDQYSPQYLFTHRCKSKQDVHSGDSYERGHWQ